MERLKLAETYIIDEAVPFIPKYLKDMKRFTHSSLYLTRKKQLKFGLRVNTTSMDLIMQDFKVTLFNTPKAFFEVNTGLCHYVIKKATSYSFTIRSRLRKEILYLHNELLYLTHSFMGYRNLVFRMNNQQEHQLLSFDDHPRRLSRSLFFSLLYKLKMFSFNFPSHIRYHYRKRSRIRAYYLGFRLIFKTSLSSFFIKNTLRKKRYKKYRRYKLKRRFLSPILKVIRFRSYRSKKKLRMKAKIIHFYKLRVKKLIGKRHFEQLRQKKLLLMSRLSLLGLNLNNRGLSLRERDQIRQLEIVEAERQHLEEVEKERRRLEEEEFDQMMLKFYTIEKNLIYLEKAQQELKKYRPRYKREHLSRQERQDYGYLRHYFDSEQKLKKVNKRVNTRNYIPKSMSIVPTIDI